MRLAASLHVTLALAATEIAMASAPSPSVTAAPMTSDNIPSTFVTTASNCTHTGQAHTVHRREAELVTSAPAVAESARPSIFTTVTCLEESNHNGEDGPYRKHICKVYEYKLLELESSAVSAAPLFGGFWAMAGVAVITMLL